MNNFLKKLDELESILKKEESNGRSSSVVSSSSGSVHRIQDSKEKGNSVNKDNLKEKQMITVEDALKDLEAIEASAVTDGIKVVRAIKVLVKFLSTMRSNQLLTDADKVAIQKAKVERQNKPVTKVA